MYKDSHDMKQTDDFDVTLLVAHEQQDEANTLHLKYYIILSSRRYTHVLLAFFTSFGQFNKKMLQMTFFNF